MIIKNTNSSFQRYWRPAMAWSYLIICIFDFLIGPIGNAVFQAKFYPTATFVSWSPITLGGGGLYHISMMAIVGVTAFSRGQEKIKLLEVLARVNAPKEEIASITPIEPSIEKAL